MTTLTITGSEFGGLCRRARAARGWSQADVAAKIGHSQGAVCRWETGQRDPALSVVLALCRVYGFRMLLAPIQGGGSR